MTGMRGRECGFAWHSARVRDSMVGEGEPASERKCAFSLQTYFAWVRDGEGARETVRVASEGG